MGVGWNDIDKWIEKGIVDEEGILVAKYDAATVNWANGWRMPTGEEMKELCTLSGYWTSVNGVNWYMFVGKNGNTIFFPAAGWYGLIDKEESGLNCVCEAGRYWSSKWCSEGQGIGMSIESKWKPGCGDPYREKGLSVRAVRRK